MGQWLGINAPERLQQHAVEPEVAARSELFEADRHSFVAAGGLRPVGSEQPVPPGQVEAVVAVGLLTPP